MQKKLFITLVFILFTTCALLSQHVNILIDSTGAPQEPTITMDLKNPDHLVAGCNIKNAYGSNDGGYTWTKQVLYSTPQLRVSGDPCVITDTSGNFYYFFLASNPSQWLYSIGMLKTSQPNGPWSNGIAIYPDGVHMHDKEWAVVDPATNNIYTTWTAFDAYGSSDPADKTSIMFSASFDQGQNWTTGIEINEVMGNCADNDNTVEGAVPTVGPNGEIYVSWAGPQGIVFDRSLDSGKTWLANDIHVDPMPDGWTFDIPGTFRCNGLPVTACDRSGGNYHGNIYINWSDQRNGTDDTDIWLSRSNDGGNTWQGPVRVNNDPPGKQQFFTWMTVDQVTGYIYCVFYDRRNYSGQQTDVYMAVSKDGGQSFTNFRISESPFYPYETVFFGDYTNIVAHNNVVRPIWARLDQDKLSLWTAIIDSTSLFVDQQQKMTSPNFTSYPNPFDETTWFSFELDERTDVNLEIFDVSGKRVAIVLENEALSRGDYSYHLSSQKYNLKPGLYFARLTANSKTYTRKMICN